MQQLAIRSASNLSVSFGVSVQDYIFYRRSNLQLIKFEANHLTKLRSPNGKILLEHLMANFAMVID